MSIALGLGTLLLAGWVLPSGESQDELPTAPTRPSGIESSQPPAPRGETSRSRAGGGSMDGQSPLYRYGTSGNSERPTRRQDQQVPLQPNDPDSPLASPTEQGGSAGSGYGTRLGGNLPMDAGSRPRGPSSASRSRSSSSSGRYGASTQQKNNPQRNLALMEQQTSSMRPSAGIPSGGAASVSKPFSNYTPSPTVSPYNDLYRTGANNTDNYYSLVRPQLDQRRANQVLGGEIRGLQSTTRLQSHAVQKLGKNNPAVQTGTMAPEYYQNYGAFYPGFSR